MPNVRIYFSPNRQAKEYNNSSWQKAEQNTQILYEGHKKQRKRGIRNKKPFRKQPINNIYHSWGKFIHVHPNLYQNITKKEDISKLREGFLLGLGQGSLKSPRKTNNRTEFLFGASLGPKRHSMDPKRPINWTKSCFLVAGRGICAMSSCTITYGNHISLAHDVGL